MKGLERRYIWPIQQPNERRRASFHYNESEPPFIGGWLMKGGSWPCQQPNERKRASFRYNEFEPLSLGCWLMKG